MVGCQKKPAAVVNGVEISRQELKWHVDERLADHRARGATVNENAIRSAVLDKLIADKLIVDSAIQKGITVSAEDVRAAAEATKEMLGREAFSRRLKSSGLSMAEFENIVVKEAVLIGRFIESLVSIEDITEDEIRAYYREAPTPMLKPEEVKVRFIQTATKPEADAVMRELRQGGAGFDEVADRLGKEKKAMVSSGYSWTTPDFFSPEIAQGIKSIDEGDFGGPYQSEKGYFIFRVEQRRHATAKTLEESRDEIRALIFEMKRQSMLNHLIAEKRKTANVVIN